MQTYWISDLFCKGGRIIVTSLIEGNHRYSDILFQFQADCGQKFARNMNLNYSAEFSLLPFYRKNVHSPLVFETKHSSTLYLLFAQKLLFPIRQSGFVSQYST